MKLYKISCIVFLSLLLAQAAFSQKPDISVSLFRDSAFGATWSKHNKNLVAFNAKQANGYFAIYFANIDSNNQRLNEHCFTCGSPLLPGKHVGSPYFQPSGKYIAMVVEKQNHPGSSFFSIPGMGAYDDIWVMTMDGNKAYQLTNTPDTPNAASGVMFPFFSPDSKQLSWTEMTDTVNIWNGKQNAGYWVIKIADFVDDSIAGPHLENIRTLQPGGTPAFNEGYGWSPDAGKIIFASDYNQFWLWDDQIYTMDTYGNSIKQMSSTATNYPYCEHAFYTPDGKYILWMTDRDNKIGSSVGGDDWWIMNSDSTNQQRLTYFNDTTSSYWTGSTHICCYGSFCPDGNKFIGDVGGNQPIQVDSTQIGSIYVVNMDKFLIGVQYENANAEQLSLYPNPSTTFLTVTMSNNKTPMHYSVYNLLGDVIAEGNFDGRSFQINVSKFSSGLYFLKLSDSTRIISRKFIVSKD